APATGACSCTAPGACASCRSCGRPGVARWRPPHTCAATPSRATTEVRLRSARSAGASRTIWQASSPASARPAADSQDVGMPAVVSDTVAPARRCAYAVLRATFERGAYTDRALRARATGLDTRDRALAMRLASGAVQRAGTLDHLLSALAERPARQLDPPLLAGLRLGLYELLYLGGAPDYAIVADAVQLAKQHGRGGHGLVNAVLRRAAREGASALLGSLSDATPEQATVMHSHPEWIVRMWWQQLGSGEARALLARDNEPAELALRANTLVSDASTLARTARRLRARNVRVEVADARQTRRDGRSFDRVLVDPPCSGLGTLQARPDLRWRVTPEGVASMAATQAEILAAGARAVCPGGL